MGRYIQQLAESSGQDLFALLKKRRSIRAFKPDPVSSAQVEAVIAAGEHAPSGGNRHPWKYVVVTDSELKKSIRQKCEIADRSWHDAADTKMQQWLEAKHITPEKEYLTEAPVLIVVFGDKNDPYWQESTWISIGYMLLAAVDQGLGSLVYTPGDPEFMNAVLSVSDRYLPQVILPLGYPLVKPQKNSKKQTEIEHQARTAGFVKEPEQAAEKEAPAMNNLFAKVFESADQDKKDKKCACGCSRKIVGLNSKRKYIHGHAKFGPGGLLKILKSPPYCKCGCVEKTDWDWEKMTWKKYIESHIGFQKIAERTPHVIRKQIDMFK